MPRKLIFITSRANSVLLINICFEITRSFCSRIGWSCFCSLTLYQCHVSSFYSGYHELAAALKLFQLKSRESISIAKRVSSVLLVILCFEVTGVHFDPLLSLVLLLLNFKWLSSVLLVNFSVECCLSSIDLESWIFISKSNESILIAKEASSIVALNFVLNAKSSLWRESGELAKARKTFIKSHEIHFDSVTDIKF